MLLEYAERKNISPFEAFRSFFVAQAELNFDFQRHMVAAFGTAAVKKFNNLISSSDLGHQASAKNFRHLAKLAGFYLNFVDARAQIKTIGLGFPGLKGRLIDKYS